MNKVIIIGEVVSQPQISKMRNNEIFTHLILKHNNMTYRVYSFKDMAVKVVDNIKQGMIVQCECMLKTYIRNDLGKFNDLFKLEVIDVIQLYINKENLKDTKGVGLNGKLLPY